MTDMKMDNWHKDPGAAAWLQHALDEMVPKVKGSSVVVSLVPNPESITDMKFAVELGVSVMLDKPIIAVVAPGRPVPKKLEAVADLLIEGDIADPLVRMAIVEAIDKYGEEEES